MGVLVTNADDWICLNICRSLGKRGIDVAVASHKKDAMSFHSRYCKQKHVYTNPSLNVEKFIEDIVNIVKKNNYEFLIPTNDVTLMAISSFRDRIEKYVDIPIPNHETLEICDDKSKSIEMARKLGIPHPKTFFVESVSDIDRIVEEFEFPIVIKPFRGQGGKGVNFVSSSDMLKDVYLKTIEQYGNVMIQEYIEGNRYLLGVIFNRNHEPRRLSLHKTIRFIGGITIFGETADQPRVIDLGLRFLEGINFFGMGMIDFIVDKKDDKPKFMEINPRFFGSISIHIAAGVDFPYLFYTMLKEGDIEKCFDYKKGIKSRHLLKDISHLLTILAGKAPYNYRLTKKQTITNFIKSFNCTSDYIFSLGDPLPAFTELKEIIYRKINR